MTLYYIKYILIYNIFIIFINIIDLIPCHMKKITLKQVLRAIVLIWIVNTAFVFYSGVYQLKKEITTEYSRIDPLLSDSPDIFLFGGHVTINPNIVSESPEIVRKLAIRGSILRFLSWFLNRLLVVLVLINIFQLLKTWNFSHLFIQENAKVVRRISWLYLGWVVVYFLIYQSATFLFPCDYIDHYYNVSTFSISIRHNVGSRLLFDILRTIRESINEEALIVFFLLFILSLTMKKGVKLQQEADLTI